MQRVRKTQPWEILSAIVYSGQIERIQGSARSVCVVAASDVSYSSAGGSLTI
jgi:hypothetical protein